MIYSFFLDLCDAVGYIEYVSPLKNKFFDAYILTFGLQETEEVRLVVFDLHQHSSFVSALNKGVTITHLAKSSGGTSDLTYTSKSKIIMMTPPFEQRRVPTVISTIKKAMTEVDMFSRVHLEVMITDIDIPGTCNNALPYQELSVTDKSLPESQQLTIYGNLVGKFQINKCYRLHFITVSTFGGCRKLKASDRSEYNELADNTIVLPAIPTISKEGIITSVSLSSLKDINLCPHCKNEVVYMRSIPTCVTCDQALALSDVITTSVIKFMLKDAAGRIPLCCDRVLMERLCGVSPTDTDVMLCKILNMKVIIKVKRLSNEVISIEKVVEVVEQTDSEGAESED